MSIEDLYQQTILEYSRMKTHTHEIPDATAAERGHNPSCGDDLTVVLKISGSTITDAAFLGNGCAISTASTNMLIECIKGKPIAQARTIISLFFNMMNNEPLTDDQRAQLGDASLLELTANMPARKKCATLSWHSANVILENL